jgi:hypothetical protein
MGGHLGATGLMWRGPKPDGAVRLQAKASAPRTPHGPADGVPVLDALGVVPHAVTVTSRTPAWSAISSIRPSTCRGPQ